MENLHTADSIIKAFEKRIGNPLKPGQLKGKKLFTGIDLGTAYIVLAVIDEDGIPVAGAMRFAQVVRDGLIVDYMGAIDIVKSLKQKIETKLGVDLNLAGVAYPPGTNKNDCKAFCNIAEGVGFKVVVQIDEPTAANKVLGVAEGAVVDIGGGTTGIAIFKNNEVVYVADEATGGTHFSLVIAGSQKISFEEAEKLKQNPKKHQSIIPTVKPVIQKVATIIAKHIKGHDVKKVILVGGTCCLTDIENIMEEELSIPVIKPVNPFLVTPLGIAISAKETHQERVKL